MRRCLGSGWSSTSRHEVHVRLSDAVLWFGDARLKVSFVWARGLRIFCVDWGAAVVGLFGWRIDC